MVDWPATLSQFKLVGLTDQRQPATVRSGVDVGPAIIRRRYTVATRNLDMPFTFTNTEREIFDAFFIDDLEEGTLSFVWTDPVTNDATSFRFREPPQFSAVSGSDDPALQRWNVTLALEIIP